MTQIEELITDDQITTDSVNIQITTIDINKGKSLFQFFSQLNGWYKMPIIAGDPHLFGFNETVIFKVDEYILPEIFHFNPARRCYIKEIDNQGLFYLYFDKDSKLDDIMDLQLILGCTSNDVKLKHTQLLRYEMLSKQNAMVCSNQIVTHDYTHEELDFFMKETLEHNFSILRSAEVDFVIRYVHSNSWRYYLLYNCTEMAASKIQFFQSDLYSFFK